MTTFGEGNSMKKLLLLALAAAAGVVAVKKAQASREEQALWSEATDPVDRQA